MGQTTGIAWCDHTFNPVIGCQAVSPGCDNCYAEAYAKRYGFDFSERRKTKTWGGPRKWNRQAKAEGVRRRVFCASLADVFDAKWPTGIRDDLWTLIAECDSLDFLLLTKRPENFQTMLPWSPKYAGPEGQRTAKAWSNVWLGVTVENQEQAERRIPLLLAQDATVRFLSMEPLLEAVNLEPLVCPNCGSSDVSFGEPGDQPWCIECDMEAGDPDWLGIEGINWAIIGGESGPKARPFALDWARSLVGQCRDAGVAPFFKQAGNHAVEAGKRLVLRDSHGGDLSELPSDLHVREFPRG